MDDANRRAFEQFLRNYAMTQNTQNHVQPGAGPSQPSVQLEQRTFSPNTYPQDTRMFSPAPPPLNIQSPVTAYTPQPLTHQGSTACSPEGVISHSITPTSQMRPPMMQRVYQPAQQQQLSSRFGPSPSVNNTNGPLYQANQMRQGAPHTRFDRGPHQTRHHPYQTPPSRTPQRPLQFYPQNTVQAPLPSNQTPTAGHPYGTALPQLNAISQVPMPFAQNASRALYDLRSTQHAPPSQTSLPRDTMYSARGPASVHARQASQSALNGGLSSPQFQLASPVQSYGRIQAPIQSTPPAPIQSTPQASIQSTPQTPIQSTPQTPVQSISQIPIQSIPQALIQSIPQALIQSTPQIPIQSISQAPVQSTPQAPVQSISHAPTQSVLQAPRSSVSVSMYLPQAQPPVHTQKSNPLHGTANLVTQSTPQPPLSNVLPPTHSPKVPPQSTPSPPRVWEPRLHTVTWYDCPLRAQPDREAKHPNQKTLLDAMQKRDLQKTRPAEFLDYLTMEHNACFKPEMKIFDVLFMQTLFFIKDNVLLVSPKQLATPCWAPPQSMLRATQLSAPILSHMFKALNAITAFQPHEIIAGTDHQRHDSAVNIVKNNGSLVHAWSISLSCEIHPQFVNRLKPRHFSTEFNQTYSSEQQVMGLNMDPVWKAKVLEVFELRRQARMAKREDSLMSR